jgi:molecular chaperone GrpE
VVNKSQLGDQANAADEAISEHLGAQPAADAANEPDAAAPGGPGDAVLDDLNELQKKASERDEFLSLLQHLRADYANYQKRVQKEMESTRRFASQGLILDLLAGLDNLERAMQAAEGTGNSTGLLDGIRLVHQQLVAALARHGVQPIAALGKPFDPVFHEALLEQPCPDKPERTVLQEFQKGYALHDRVIRPAKVVVSSAGAVTTDAVPSSAEPNSN